MKKRSLWGQIYKNKRCYISLLPTFILLAIFAYYPPISAIYHSFFQWDGARAVFIGLGNFKEMINDEVLISSIGNMLKLIIFSLIAGSLLAPLSVAELLYNMKNQDLSRYYRLAFIIPVVVPGVVMMLIWQFIYEPYSGFLNAFLRVIGLGKLEQVWLGDPKLALYCLMFMGFPWVSGVAVLIYLAGLQNIPDSTIEAATLDGALGLTRILKIDIPLIMGQIKLMLILGIIGGLQGFAVQLVLTRGGPGTSTMVPGMHMYQMAFHFGRMGYASAIGFAMFIVILAVTYLNMKYIRSSVEYEPGRN